MYHLFIRPLLFLFPPEFIHHVTFRILKVGGFVPGLSFVFRKIFSVSDPKLERTLFGITFPNPVGLAAGFDKDAVLIDELATFGFGFIEIGTLTPKPQPGNDKPRLFRLPQDQALINRMGFNNQGVDALVERLKQFDKPEGFIVGGNIGKNKDSIDAQILSDYLYCFQALFDYVDYFTINVSSPNTPGLRALQDKEPLDALLSAIQTENTKRSKPKPLFLKIAPDLSKEALDDILKVVEANHFSGIIISNTTIDRPDFLIEKYLSKENGGLSGEALHLKSMEVLQYLKSKADSKMQLIGVGGIMNPKDAVERINAGAQWIQIYTGMIYEGPWFIKRIKRRILESFRLNE